MVRVPARLTPRRAFLSAALAMVVVTCSGLPSATAATLRVSTTRDELIRHDRRCSLREAIAAANSPGRRTDCGVAGRGPNTVALRSGRYALSLPPAGPDGNASGDLNVTGRTPLTITGAGPHATTIDAAGAGDRVVTVARGAWLKLVQLSITGGAPRVVAPSGSQGAACARRGSGGGIFNLGGLALRSVEVIGNRAGAGSSGCAGSGGGVYNGGSLTLTDSAIEDNRAGAGGTEHVGGAGGAGGSGGGIYSRGKLTVISSTIDDNRAGAGGSGAPGGRGGGGGGIFSTVGRLRLINSTLVRNSAGNGGAGGGQGGNGGAVVVTAAPSLLRNATLAGNRAGAGGPSGPTAADAGPPGVGGALFVQSGRPADAMRLQNTILATSPGSGCARTAPDAIANRGHDLTYRSPGCPGSHGNPQLGPLRDYGGSTKTMALGTGSAAIGRIPGGRGHCPATDQRGVRRPEGRGCDIGAYEFAVPKITILAPFHGSSFERGSLVRARFRCGEGGVASTVATCRGTVASGHRIPTGRLGRLRFRVTAIDKSGHRTRRTVHYVVWHYVNPVQRVRGLAPRRIDLGVDYGGSGPLLALGRGRVTMASNTDDGPESCWTVSCWPGGGIVVYRLLDGPFAGKYVYVAEHLRVTVKAGEVVRAGQQIATLYSGYPWSEFGWAAGGGPEALADADGHRCPCSDPGGWSSIEGRNMNYLLVRLGAPSGYLQSSVPDQSMPRGWPRWPGSSR